MIKRKNLGFIQIAALFFCSIAMIFSSCNSTKNHEENKMQSTEEIHQQFPDSEGQPPFGEGFNPENASNNHMPMFGKKGEVYKTEAKTVIENVHYASLSESEVCDIYLPESSKKTPVLFLVHGGGFAFETNRMSLMECVAQKAVQKGYAVVAVDYRKSGEAQFPGALSDVKACVRFIKAHEAEYNIDTEKTVIWGESAGAYLSLMTSLTSNVKELNGDITENSGISSSVNVLVDFYGPVEFYTMDEEYKSLGIKNTSYSTDKSFESRFLGQAVGKDKTQTYKTYWENYTSSLKEDFSLKAWIQAGTGDKNVPYTQSKNFAQRSGKIIGTENVKFSLQEGASHMDKCFYTEENLNAIFSWIGY